MLCQEGLTLGGATVEGGEESSKAVCACVCERERVCVCVCERERVCVCVCV